MDPGFLEGGQNNYKGGSLKEAWRLTLGYSSPEAIECFVLHTKIMHDARF